MLLSLTSNSRATSPMAVLLQRNQANAKPSIRITSAKSLTVRRARYRIDKATSTYRKALTLLRQRKAPKASIDKLTEKFNLHVLKIKIAANNALATKGLPTAFDLGANAGSLISGPKTHASTPALRRMIEPYIKMFNLSGFAESLFLVDPKKPIPYKAPVMSRLVPNVLAHVRVYSEPANKILNVGALASDDAIAFIKEQGYPTALLRYSELDTTLSKFMKFATPASTSTFVLPVINAFIKSPYTGTGLIEELAAFLAGLSKSEDNAAGMLRTMPALKALPGPKDTANWALVARLYLSYILGDVKLRASTLRALPKTLADLKAGAAPRNGISAAEQSKTAQRHAVVMVLTIILHRVLAGLMHYSKKAKWTSSDAEFVGRVVNAYATMLASIGSSGDDKGMFPSMSSIQLFYLRSKSADAMLTKSGISTKFATLIKPYATVASVKTLYEATAARPNASKTAAADFVVEKPKRLTAKNVSSISAGQLAWMLANDPRKLLDLYDEGPQFDLDFSALRAVEMKPLAQYLSTSDAYATNIPSKFSMLLTARWGVAPLKAARLVASMATLPTIGIDNVARLAEFKSLTGPALKTLISKFDSDASRYLALNIIAKSRTANAGAFGRISAAHAKFNSLNTSKVVHASDLISGTKEELRDRLVEASVNIDDAILDSGRGAATVAEFAARVKAAFKEIQNTSPEQRMKVAERPATQKDVTNILEAMSFKHGIVAFKINAAFDVKTGARPSTNTQTVKQAWHGTDMSAASCIALLGFRVGRGNIKAGRSMGDVVYVAPNADKSMQYLNSSFGRSGSGVLFVGPAYVAGAPTARAKAKHAKYAWTHTARFATDEIGLTDANLQYDINTAFAVSTLSGKHIDHSVADSDTRVRAINAAKEWLPSPAAVVKAIQAARGDSDVVALMLKHGIGIAVGDRGRGVRKFIIK